MSSDIFLSYKEKCIPDTYLCIVWVHGSLFVTDNKNMHRSQHFHDSAHFPTLYRFHFQEKWYNIKKSSAATLCPPFMLLVFNLLFLLYTVKTENCPPEQIISCQNKCSLHRRVKSSLLCVVCNLLHRGSFRNLVK